MPQLYANTVLASLNARQLASGRHTHHWSSTIDSGEVSELTARSYKPRVRSLHNKSSVTLMLTSRPAYHIDFILAWDQVDSRTSSPFTWGTG
jgi:hypothetical protein